jgi:hypothetical protein
VINQNERISSLSNFQSLFAQVLSFSLKKKSLFAQQPKKKKKKSYCWELGNAYTAILDVT